jgi:hypothetical protein
LGQAIHSLADLDVLSTTARSNLKSTQWRPSIIVVACWAQSESRLSTLLSPNFSLNEHRKAENPSSWRKPGSTH